jgi:hypothetical protein
MRLVPASLASILLLAAWLGAAVLVAAVVAPAAFAVLPTRTLAGAVVGRVLPVLFWSGLGVGLVVSVLARGRTGRGWILIPAALLALSSAIAQFVLTPRIAGIRTAAGAIDALDPTDPRRLAFGRLHGLSVACLGLGAVAATVALVAILVQFDRLTD